MTERSRSSIVMWALAAYAALAVACAPATRHAALTFFFDGVPTAPEQPDPTQPDDKPADAPPSARQVAYNQDEAAPESEPIDSAPALRSIHEPVRRRQCTLCHDMTRTDGFDPTVRDSRLCDRCHMGKRLELGWNHGPINLGSCMPCHEPHDSPLPHLLSQPVTDLCSACHAEDLARGSVFHAMPGAANCTRCHDPHRPLPLTLRGGAG